MKNLCFDASINLLMVMTSGSRVSAFGCAPTIKALSHGAEAAQGRQGTAARRRRAAAAADAPDLPSEESDYVGSDESEVGDVAVVPRFSSGIRSLLRASDVLCRQPMDCLTAAATACKLNQCPEFVSSSPLALQNLLHQQGCRGPASWLCTGCHHVRMGRWSGFINI